MHQAPIKRSHGEGKTITSFQDGSNLELAAVMINDGRSKEASIYYTTAKRVGSRAGACNSLLLFFGTVSSWSLKLSANKYTTRCYIKVSAVFFVNCIYLFIYCNYFPNTFNRLILFNANNFCLPCGRN